MLNQNGKVSSSPKNSSNASPIARRLHVARLRRPPRARLPELDCVQRRLASVVSVASAFGDDVGA